MENDEEEKREEIISAVFWESRRASSSAIIGDLFRLKEKFLNTKYVFFSFILHFSLSLSL